MSPSEPASEPADPGAGSDHGSASEPRRSSGPAAGAPSVWPAHPTWRPSRRDFLRAVGIGGGASALTWAGARSAAAALGAATTPEPDDGLPDAALDEGWRRPGGPAVEELALELGYDVDAIFRFVADEVQYDPYVGSLRGPTGTLWSRAGNSVDQALLLTALLDAALVPSRLVTGTLDDAAASRLAAAATIDLETLQRSRQAVFRPSGPPRAQAAGTPLTPDDERMVQELPQRAAALRATALGQLEDSVAIVTAALSQAGVELPPPDAVLPARERREHVWVQYASGADWIDLDPSLPGAAPRDTIAEVGEVLDELPRELRHSVTLRLTAEIVRAGTPRNEQLLAYELFTDELAGRPVSIGHAKPEGLDGLGATLTGTLEGSVQYMPILLVGTEGEIGHNRVTFNTGGGVLSALDLDGDGYDTEGDTLAEWLEVTITSPDAPVHSVRREIFDRVGAVARHRGETDLADVAPLELVDLGPGMSREFPPLRMLWSLGITGGSVPWDYFDQDPTIADVFADFGLVSNGYHLVREALSVELAAATGHRHVPVGPNVTAFVAGPSDPAAVGGPRISSTIDLLSRAVAAVPMAGEAPAGRLTAAHPLVIAGALGHVAERLCAGDTTAEPLAAPGADAEPGSLRRASVGRVFEAAARDGVAIIGLLPDETVAPDELPAEVRRLEVSAGARLQIAAALAAGLIVIVPERSVEVDGVMLSGWWLVDPATATTIDMLEDGRGAEFAEYFSTLSSRFRAWGGFTRLGGCIGKHATVAAAAIGVAGSYQGLSEAAGITLGVAQAAVEAAGNFSALC